MKEIKIGIIGLGARGSCLLKDVILPQKAGTVTAVCDLYEDRAEDASKQVAASQGNTPRIYTDWREVIADNDVNTVIITSSWDAHIDIAIKAMEARKAVGMEVGGAYSIHECWQLVETWEKTQTPFMLLENCVFGRRELMVLHMVQQGLFGKVVHCSGGYHHDLREEVAFGKEKRHYRLRNYIGRNCENYPTHELGPIARVLNINHGNRMLTISSVASCAEGLHDYILKNKSDDIQLTHTRFQQGDIVTSVIRCANGETITLTLDTTLPRYYSRGFTVRGTNGMYEEATDSVFLDRDEDKKIEFDWRKRSAGNAEQYCETWEHPLWKEFIEEGVQGSHDGMDWLEFKAFFDCLKNDKPMPVDVYDAASWMAVTALSEASIAKGGIPVEFPDFTKGKWLQNCMNLQG